MLQTKVDMKPEPQERSEAELRPAEIAATDQPLKVQAFTLTAQHLASDAPAIGPETTGARVLELFRSNTALPLLAVTDAEGVVYGAVERDRLLSVFAQPLWFDVYFKRSIQALMNRQPLVVDEETPLDEIKRLITASHPDAIQSGFLVTRGGRFSGIGTMAKLLELTVEQAQRRLEQLDEARHAAEFAASSRAKFLATMSHELRTPLNAIIGFSELLLGLPGAGRDAPQLPDYIGDIRQSGQHLLGLINDILDYSKLEAGALTLNAVTFQLDEMLQSALGVTRGQAASRNVHLELAPTAPISVLADERGRFRLGDNEGTELIADRLLLPLFCLRAGKRFEHKIELINSTRVLRLRDHLLPLVALSDCLNLIVDEDRGDRSACIVIMQVGELRFGLIVDEVFDTEEIVVKPMSSRLRAYNASTSGVWALKRVFSMIFAFTPAAARIAGATWSRTRADMSWTSARNTASFESK